MQIVKDADLSQVLWYKIGGIAKYLLVCASSEDVLEAVRFLKKEKIAKYFVVGQGSNLLFTDEYYDGAVIQLIPNENSRVSLDGKNMVKAFAGETLDSVIQFSFSHSLIGLEWAGGLPGTVGAGIRGNVGAFGGEISKTFAGCDVLDVSGNKLEVKTLNRRDIKFSYRNSTVKKNPNLIVLTVRFQLKKADASGVGKAKTTYFANIEYRKQKHPLEYPSTGSAFKNIAKREDVEKVLAALPDIEQDVKIKWHGKVSMGYLNKRLDLAGLRIGNAQISNKHSNFIVNLGGAKFTDVLSIIEKIKETFMDEFGFSPEPEVEIVR